MVTRYKRFRKVWSEGRRTRRIRAESAINCSGALLPERDHVLFQKLLMADSCQPEDANTTHLSTRHNRTAEMGRQTRHARSTHALLARSTLGRLTHDRRMHWSASHPHNNQMRCTPSIHCTHPCHQERSCGGNGGVDDPASGGATLHRRWGCMRSMAGRTVAWGPADAAARRQLAPCERGPGQLLHVSDHATATRRAPAASRRLHRPQARQSRSRTSDAGRKPRFDPHLCSSTALPAARCRP